jgi:1-acyl-sn-glycerol-3-phosphate acyltransferase
MALDGFRPTQAVPFVGYDEAVAEPFWRGVAELGERLGVELSGIEHLPPGGALLVMNHAFGWDAMLPMAAIRARTGRRVWALGEHLWWKLPFVRRLACAVGTVDGTPEHAQALLERGELVLVMPGGMREALKPVELRYRLLWGDRLGFVRCAWHAGVPIVPVAGFGADEIIGLSGDAFARGRQWLRIDFPLPRPTWGIPWIRPQKLSYELGEPIEVRPYPDEDEAHMLRRVRDGVRGSIEGMLDERLAARVVADH